MTSQDIKHALVVGSGSIARRHIKNLRCQYPDAKVTCVSASGRQLSITDVGATHVAEDLNTAIASHPELAIVASPTPWHLEHASTLLTANIPTLIEKPLCVALTDIEHYKLDKHSSPAGVAYNLRFMPGAKVMKQLLEKSAIGSISTVFVEVGQYLPDWRPETNYREGVSARQALGGGALLELSHEIDYLNWLVGPFEKALGSVRSTGLFDIDVEDSVDALLVRNDGVVAHLHLDFIQRQPCRAFKAVGSEGTLVWDLLHNEVKMFHPNGCVEVLHSDPKYDRNQMYIHQMEAFIGFVHGDIGFDSTVVSGISVMKIVDAIRTSSQKNAWVKVERA